MNYTTINNVLLHTDNDMVVKDANGSNFEPETFACIKKLLANSNYTNNKCAVDVGAYTGVYSLNWALHYSFTNVYAFEPNPIVYERLTQNVTLNNLQHNSKIKCINKAVGNITGEVALYSKKFKMTSASTMHQSVHTPNVTLVDIVKLDEFNLNAPVGAIKIDVEGHEKEVLLGASETIKKDKPVLIIETLSKQCEQEVTDMLATLGYSPQNICYGLDNRNLIAY